MNYFLLAGTAAENGVSNVDLILEFQRIVIVFRHNGFRMTRVIFIDMRDRLVNGIHNLHRNDGVQILCSPVFLRCRNDLPADCLSTLIPPDFYIVTF